MATPETKDDAPVDTRDALEVLESEAKEWDKVCPRCSACTSLSMSLTLLRMPKSTAS
jgi:hypothetical protein